MPYRSTHTGAVPPQTCRLESSVARWNVREDASLYIQHGSTRHATFDFKNTTLKPTTMTPTTMADYLHALKSRDSQTAESWLSLLASYLHALAPVNDWCRTPRCKRVLVSRTPGCRII